LQLFSFGGYGLALAALALLVFGAYDSYPNFLVALLLEGSKVIVNELTTCRVYSEAARIVTIFQALKIRIQPL